LDLVFLLLQFAGITETTFLQSCFNSQGLCHKTRGNFCIEEVPWLKNLRSCHQLDSV
jgi:hypothetical protein